MNTLDLVKQHLLGKLAIGDYIAAFIFCAMGLFVATWFRTRRRNRSSTSTPVHFHLGFFIMDNIGKWVSGLIVLFIIFRFCDELIASGSFSMKLAVGVGFFISVGLEIAIQALMNKFDWLCDKLGLDREKFMEKLVEKSTTEVINQKQSNES